MRFIVTVGWSIYPLGYYFGYLVGAVDDNALNLVYNIADLLNKIWFCLASPNLSAGTDVMTLKSRQPPQTTRCTPVLPSTAFTLSNTATKAFCASSKDLSLSADHLQRHSR